MVTEIEEIYKDYFEDVYLFVYSLAKDKQIAEDITSDTFLKAIKSVDNFKGNCDIRVWLCQIAKNSYISYLRKNKKVVNLDPVYEVKDDLDVEKLTHSSEETKKIHDSINNLSEPYKKVFSLRVFSELSFNQIADLFGKTANWACVTFHRAKNKIREEARCNDESNM